MRILAHKEFDPLTISIKDNGESVQVVIADDEVSHAAPVEDYEVLFDEEQYNPLRVSDKPSCCVCGGEGAYHRYKYSSFSIHPDCRLALRDCIEEVIEDNSNDVVGATV